jgi:hypothetical protein
MTKRVACIGSREITKHQSKILQGIGYVLATKGFVISSGNAIGSDQSYAKGANKIDPNLVELHQAWRKYEKQAIVDGNKVILYEKDYMIPEFIMSESKRFYGDWFDKMSSGVRRLMIRNIGIVNDSLFVIAVLNPDKKSGGGIGNGVRYAKDIGIPILSLNETYKKFNV